MSPIITEFKKYWQDVPFTVRKFLISALILFTIWKFSYHLYFKPHRLLDVPLTELTSKHTKTLLSFLYPQYHFSEIVIQPKTSQDFFGISIYKYTKKILSVFDPCNALELYVLYIAFIVCMPSNWKRMLFFIIAGLASIYLLNIIRCTFLGILNLNRSVYVDFAHHYLFTMVVYIAIFLIWALYIKKSTDDA